jgi:hypothetical protein
MNNTFIDNDIIHIDMSVNLPGDILTTLRKPRVDIFDVSISIFDLTGTLFISYLIAKKFDLNIPLTMATSIPLGYLAHNLFSIETGSLTPYGTINK